MDRLFLDFESFWSDDYTLKKMTQIEYILDPRFEAIGCAFQWQGADPFWVDGPDLPVFFSKVDFRHVEAISHNAAFDMLILALRYHLFPSRYGCTMSMAQNWLGNFLKSVGLDSVGQYFGLPPKRGTTQKFKGKTFAEIKADPELYQETVVYAIEDVTSCRVIFDNILALGFPPANLDVIHWVIRMIAQPQLVVDGTLIAEHLTEVLSKKQQLLETAGMDSRDNLMSDDKLAGILSMLGVDCPRKISKTTGQEQWAFAKTDKEFTDLLDHPNLDVQAVVAARLGHKSTLEESRTRRFLAISQITNAMPIPLRYSGAHTHRLSGDWSLNLQNLPNKSKLRKALKAPKGYVIVDVDASQIEARLNATLAGEHWLVEAFRAGKDVYCDFASMLYGRAIVKGLDDLERFVGKTGILSLGYGSSWLVFQNMVRNKGGIKLTDAMANHAVTLYRVRCSRIVDNWKAADREILPMLVNGHETEWGPIGVRHEKLILPDGNELRYWQLRQEYSALKGRTQWVYTRKDRPQFLYGAKIVENVCQALAFVHIKEVAMRVAKLTEGLFWPAHQVHDELLYVAPESLAELLRDLVVKEMSTSPRWLPHAPLAAEGHIGVSYGDLK